MSMTSQVEFIIHGPKSPGYRAKARREYKMRAWLCTLRHLGSTQSEMIVTKALHIHLLVKLPYCASLPPSAGKNMSLAVALIGKRVKTSGM